MEDKYNILSLRVGLNGSQEFWTVIVDEFGSSVAASKIPDSILYSGPFGLEGMLANIINPFLDSLPLSDESYTSLFLLLQPFCLALAHKVRTYSKVSHLKYAIYRY